MEQLNPIRLTLELPTGKFSQAHIIGTENFKAKLLYIREPFINSCITDLDRTLIYISFGYSRKIRSYYVDKGSILDLIIAKSKQHLEVFEGLIIFDIGEREEEGNLELLTIAVFNKLQHINLLLMNRTQPTLGSFYKFNGDSISKHLKQIDLLFDVYDFHSFIGGVKKQNSEDEQPIDKEKLRDETLPIETYRLISKDGSYDARGYLIGDKFVLKAGSILRMFLENHGYNEFNEKRVRYIRSGIIVNEGGNLVLKKDIEFESPSGAACFVNLVSTNGWRAWKTTTGKPLDSQRNK